MKRKDWLYFAGYACGAAVISGILAWTAVWDRYAQIPHLWSTLTKCLVILLLYLFSGLSGKRDRLFQGKLFTRDALWILLPLILSILANYGTVNTRPGIVKGVMVLLSVVTTVVWEELYFRYVGQLLFEREGVYHILWVVLSALVFGLSQLVELIFLDIGVVLMQVILSVAHGVFLLALYARTRNLLLPVAAHFALDIAAAFFSHFSTGASGLGGLGLFYLGVLTVAYTAVGFWMLFRSHLLIERKPGSSRAPQHGKKTPPVAEPSGEDAGGA